MAHFYGWVEGSRSSASRCGTKGSGYTAKVGSWQGGVSVSLVHNEETGEDMLSVDLIQWQNGAGVNRPLYYGPVSGKEPHAR